MLKLIKYEFRKLWNRVTILAILLMVLVLSSYYFIVEGDKGNTAVGNNGEIVHGIRAYSVLREQSKDIEGVMDQKYIDKLVKNYNSSNEKSIYKTDSNTPYIKYIFPNFFINFANYGEVMNQDRIDLNFSFLNSEEELYGQYKTTVKRMLKERNERNGLFKYTDAQLDKINKKIDKIETPFKVEYEMGLERFIYMYGSKYWLVLIIIVFALSTVFSKNSTNGIDELSLSTAFGRKRDMNARIIAGNIFAIIAYGIFVASLLLIIGLTASLQGLGASAQIFWNLCPYSISIGHGIVIMLFMGLLGVLVVANLIMLVSISFRNYKISAGISLGAVLLLLKLTQTTDQLQLQLNPIFFSSHFTTSNLADFEIFYFIGEKMIPYSAIVIILFSIYMAIIRLLTLKSYKRYKLN